MTDQRQDGLPPQPPTVAPPARFVERRKTFRRAEDRVAHEEKVLLARALDVLASDGTAEDRLAGLLRLLARTVGARRVAVVADGIDRRAAVAIDVDEDPAEAQQLASWLDANAPRSRARRAAAGRAPISFIVGGRARPTDETAETSEAADPNGSSEAEPALAAAASAPPDASSPAAASAEPVDTSLDAAVEEPEAAPAPRHFAMLPIPTAGEVTLGFEFRRPGDAGRLAERLPPTMARHAGVALSLVTSQLAGERELAGLRARDVERTTFVSTVAHELRTPLTGLRGYLELILGGQVLDSSVEHDFLERSRSIVGSMTDLVGDLLELSRLESGTISLEIGPFSIAEAGAQVASSLLPIAIDHGTRLTTALPPRMRVATGDRRRVEQILTNLVANALKFTPAGGSVEIEGRVDGLTAVLVVRDDGEGIPAEDRDRIFERFQRLTGHERVAGTGLGLPIARDLARQMDGDLDVASVPGAGSAFVLVLAGPAAVEPAEIQASLARALEAEEVGLEERIVRRAIAAVGKDGDGTGDDDADGRRARLRALPSLHEDRRRA
ncbi:MAG TPA: ATP-binding protein [Candidatus Limnocylindrales bacterium]|jgi:signal transduction histidine kinase